MIELRFCTVCKTHVKSLDRHFQRGMKTFIRTNYYCECKPRRYYGDWNDREGWERVEVKEAVKCFKCLREVSEEEQFYMVKGWCKECYQAWLNA